MAIVGRRPKPTHLRLVTGNAGKRPLPKAEARVNPALPTPPPHLADEAKVEWGRVSEELYKVGLLSGLDRAALAAYCQAYARWVHAETRLNQLGGKVGAGGMLITTKNGNLIQNPMVGIANKAAADMVRYAVEFGMTPSARSRIAAQPPADSEDPASQFFS